MSYRERKHNLLLEGRSHIAGEGVIIGEMTPGDLDAIMDIETQSFVSPWSRNCFLDELRGDHAKIYVARPAKGEKPKVVGYLCAWFVADEAHILNLACHPRFRRRKIASALLETCLTHAAAKGVRWIYLEVRRSNLQALSLYAKYGFKPVGLRKGYYTDTREDAVVMVLAIGSSPSCTYPPR